MPSGSKERRPRNWRPWPARQGRPGCGQPGEKGTCDLQSGGALREGCAVRQDGEPCWMESRGVSGKDLHIFTTESEPWPRPEL